MLPVPFLYKPIVIFYMEIVRKVAVLPSRAPAHHSRAPAHHSRAPAHHSRAPAAFFMRVSLRVLCYVGVQSCYQTRRGVRCTLMPVLALLLVAPPATNFL